MQNLRAEARLVTAAGAILLVIGFALTLALAALAMPAQGVSPIWAFCLGGPPIALGWIACRYASSRLEKARLVEAESARPARAEAAPLS